MRTRRITIAAIALIVAAVALALRSEERFVVEGLHLEGAAGGVRLAGVLHNTGPAAARVVLELEVVRGDGTRAEKETLELRDVASGSRVSFASRLYPDAVRSYSVHLAEGRNPYGN